jgi:hypothetical protein
VSEKNTMVHGGPGHLKSQAHLDLVGLTPFGTQRVFHSSCVPGSAPSDRVTPAVGPRRERAGSAKNELRPRFRAPAGPDWGARGPGPAGGGCRTRPSAADRAVPARPAGVRAARDGEGCGRGRAADADR